MCSSCEALVINGVLCHETGCPESHVGTIRECKNCGQEFEPANRWQVCCDDSCYLAYHGYENGEHDPRGEEFDDTSDDNWACGTLDIDT